MINKDNIDSEDYNKVILNLDMAKIISNVIVNNVSNILDFQMLFMSLLGGYFLILCYSEEYHEPLYYMPLFFLALNIVAAIGISFSSNLKFSNGFFFFLNFKYQVFLFKIELASFGAKQIKYQIIVSNLINFLSIMIFALYLIPKSIKIIDTNNDIFTIQSITRNNIIVCLICGLIT